MSCVSLALVVLRTRHAEHACAGDKRNGLQPQLLWEPLPSRLLSGQSRRRTAARDKEEDHVADPSGSALREVRADDKRLESSRSPSPRYIRTESRARGTPQQSLA